MADRDHNPHRRRLHLPIVSTNPSAAEERKPPWLKVRLQTGPNYQDLKGIMRGLSLHTVCEEAMCPNIHECWEEREATFLILGDKCTRRCGFCDVMTAKPRSRRRGRAASDRGSGDRDGAAVRRPHRRRARRPPRRRGTHLGRYVRAIREAIPGCGVEVLPADFSGGERDLATVIESGPDVFAHNLETVRRLHGRIRPAFGYERSLDVLRIAKALRSGQVTKSNLILGMGERPDEIPDALRDIADAGADIVTIGQYLRPTEFHLPVDRWVTPDEFAEWKRVGEDELGIAHVEAGPLVRSSYHAGKQLRRALEASAPASR